MFKQIFITGVAATSLMLSAQVSAHQNNSRTAHVNNGHSHHQPAPRRAKFNVNREQREQANMIKQGIKTCQITPQEAQKLKSQQNRIKKAEKRMRRDGLQRWERMDLKSRLHTARVKINKLTKNSKRCRTNRRHHRPGHNGYRNNHRSNTTWSHNTRHGSFSISIGH